MLLKNFKLISWNTRGLGDVDKCKVVRNVIRQERVEVVCLQETKWNRLDYSYVAAVLLSYYDMAVVYTQASNSAGGCLIGWKRAYTLLNSWVTKHTCTAQLRHIPTDQEFSITNVYGPSNEREKGEFIEELRQVAANITGPWIIAGDFNLVRWIQDRSADHRGIAIMDAFNDFIREEGLLDVHLANRQFTWSSKRPQPILSKLDRVMLSTEWVAAYPVISLTAKAMIVSDHVPILLQCKQPQTRPREYKIELFWFNYRKMDGIVNETWQANLNKHTTDPTECFTNLI